MSNDMTTIYFSIIDDFDMVIMNEGTAINKDMASSVLKKKSKYGITISSDITGRNFCKDPYFKFFKGESYDKAVSNREITRIAIFRAEYVSHINQDWDIPPKDRRNLMKILKAIYKNNEKDKTGWEIVLDECIHVITTGIEKYTQDDLNKIKEAELPDYIKIKFPSKNNKIIRKEYT